MSDKYALIIANTEYTDSGLAQLTAPGKDAEDFARVLLEKNLCAFDDVKVLVNENSNAINEAIDEFFDQKKQDDLLLLYFSGHGIRDELGSLYLAVQNTMRNRLRVTAVKSDFIRESMDRSRSRRQVLILDCCNSGAFAQGTKAATGVSVGTATAFEGGFGRVILTASDSTQFAWEGDKVIGRTNKSLFTHFLVEGLEGKADGNRDGQITVDDLYNYAYEQVLLVTPKQTPSKFATKQQGEIVLREYTEEQKEQLKLQIQREETEKERIEKERLERLQQEKESAEQRRREILEAKQIAELEALEVQKQLELQSAEIEASKQKLTQLRITQLVPKEKKAPQFVKIALGVIGILILIVAGYSITSKGKRTAQTTDGTTSDGSFTTENEIVSSEAEEFVFSPPSHPLSVINTPIPEVSTIIGAENAETVSQLARWGKGIINEAVFSPDGTKIALATSIGMYILDTESLETIRFIETGKYNILGASFSEDQKEIIALSTQGDALIFDLEKGSFIKGYRGKFDFVHAFSFFSSENALATFGYTESGTSKEIFVQNLTNGSTQKITTNLAWASSPIHKLELSPDGKILGGSTRGGMVFWDRDGTIQWQYPLEENWSTDLSFSPDGSMAAFVDISTLKIVIVDPNTGKVLTELEGHNAYPSALAFSPDGERLYYTVGEGVIRVRDLSDQSLLDTYQESKDEITNITFPPGGDVFLVARYNGSYELWDVKSGKSIRTISDHWSRFSSMALSPDSRYIVGIESSGHVFEIQGGVAVSEFEGTDFWVSACAFNPSNGNLVSAPGNISVWKMSEGEMQLVKATEIYPGDFVAVAPDGSFIAIDTSTNISIYNYNDILTLDYPQSVMTLSGSESITDLKISPDGNLIASALSDGTVQIWNALDGSVKYTLNGFVSRIPSVAFSPDGNQLAASSDDGFIITWDLRNGELEGTYEVPTGEYPEKTIYSPNGEIIAVSTYDGDIVLLNAKDGKPIKTLEGHSDQITGLLFTSDSKILISSSYDGTIRLWGIPDQQ